MKVEIFQMEKNQFKLIEKFADNVGTNLTFRDFCSRYILNLEKHNIYK